jgi:ethanolamine kinase
MPHAPNRDDPTKILPLRLSADQPGRDARARAIAAAALPGWPAAQATVEAVSGGITNALLRLRAPDGRTVLVRGYGPNTEVVIDRDRENRTFARLSAAGFAPPYLARFEDGRVEGDLVGFRPLEPHEMGADRWRRGIANRLAELHGHAPEQPAPRTFETLQGWMQTAQACRFEGAAADAHAALDLAHQAAELDRLQAHFTDRLLPDATHPGSAAAVRSVLAHNDLLSGNILVHEGTDEVRFIDYEYGDTGYAGFDVANHFGEYAGFDSDFEAGFPDAVTRRDFAGAYLGTDDPDTLDGFDRMVRFFTLVDHLWWGAWAVVQARHSPIDFDFMDYAGLRFAGLAFHTARWGPDAAG